MRKGLRYLSVGAAAFLFLSLLVDGQEFTSTTHSRTTDWTAHHLLISPATAAIIQRRAQLRKQRQDSTSLPYAKVPAAVDVPPQEAFHIDLSALFQGGKSAGKWLENLGSGATVGATNYPAKYEFELTKVNCGTAAQPDFVIYPTGLMGAVNQASIVAYDNLYTGCGGTVPQIYWAYNTGGQITTSPVFSDDGKQVAFVQTNGSGDAQVVLLKWAASTSETITSPLTLSRVTNAAYPACVAPCMTTGIFVNVTVDANSSLFYDYADDIAYVGDAGGYLHKISPVFDGPPSEVTSAGWPVQVNSLAPTSLTSPVYDPASGVAFVADAGGFLYRVGPGSAFVAQSGQLDFSVSRDGGPGITQGPVVDSDAEVVYVYATSDGSGNCVGGTDCTAIYQLPVDFPENARGTKTSVGASTIAGSVPSPLHIGAFDSTYIASGNGTGNIYVCGNTGGPPILYQVQLSAAAFGSVISGPVLSTSSITPCSPISDIANPNASGGPSEWIFVSAQNGGASSGCSSGGCIFNFTNTPWLANTAYSVGQQVLDSNFQIQVVTKAGTSGATTPAWSTTPGTKITEGTVTWIDQGVQSAFTPAAWVEGHVYLKGTRILDGNGNIELVATAGTSGATEPTFNANPGRTTRDNTVTWKNVGSPGTAALASSGGASGIVMDNIVGSGTLAGASQIYFSTLGNQSCGTTGTGGCAVQVSQAGLQ